MLKLYYIVSFMQYIFPDFSIYYTEMFYVPMDIIACQ